MYQPGDVPARPRRRLLWGALAGVLVLALVAGAFGGGYFMGRQNGSITELNIPSPFDDAGSDPGRLVDEVNAIIAREALVPSSAETLSAGAVEGVLRSLDDTYAAYFDKKEYRAFSEQNHGSFVGIGITITVKDGKAVVVNTLPGSPAEKAGVRPKDEIVAVDGVKKHPWVLDDIVSRVRGPENTKVTLVMRRSGTKKELSVTIVRERIDLPNSESKMIGRDVGYIRLFTFNEPSAGDLEKAIRSLEKRGAKGFVLDLRDNPGGLLTSAVEVSSLFLPAGEPLVRIEERGKPEKVEDTVGGFRTDKPLVVLVNGDSASASEIVGGALQDYDRAVVIGEKSFGKGSVQTIEERSNGGAIKLTTAHYLTPKRRVINHKGLVPDVVVKMDPELQSDQKKDVQLQRAVKELREKL